MDTRRTKTYFFLAIVIILPFIGFWLGDTFGPSSNLSVTNMEDMATTAPPEPSTTDVPTGPTAYQLVPKELPPTNTTTDVPQTELFLATIQGDDSDLTALITVDGTCTVNTYINIYEATADYIDSKDQVVNQVSCWFAGAGSETYLYKESPGSNTYQIITFETGECGDLPVSECNPYGPVRVLRTIE